MIISVSYTYLPKTTQLSSLPTAVFLRSKMPLSNMELLARSIHTNNEQNV
jgi:hypothetical protein